MKVLSIVPRVHLTDLSPQLDFYKTLLGQAPRTKLDLDNMQVARFDNLLLLAGTIEDTQKVVATIVVDCITEAKELVLNFGGEIIVEPTTGPTGLKMIARHPDGNSFEYIEPTNIR